jgi:putative peptidoglycan lipid II flippase
MTLSAALLVLLVRRAWGPEVTRGMARTLGAVVVAVALAVLVGDLVTRGRSYDGLADAALWGVATGALALVTGLLTVFYGDRTMMGQMRDRGRSRRRGGEGG